MINPGVGVSDYQHERDPTLRDGLLKNLRQELDGVDHPLLSLDPRFSHTGGFEYWTGKKMLKGIIELLKQRDGLDEALRTQSRLIATVEVVPYKSYRFHP